jgi:mannose-6-phosphate isomerase-like protein (cupin superfamily)
MVNRRNGHRRFFALKDESRLEKVSVPAVGRQVVMPFRPVVLTHVDTYAVYLMLSEGASSWWRTEHQDSLILCYSGHLDVETEHERLSLEDKELVVVPKGVAHKLSSTDRTVVMGLRRHKHPSLPNRDP